MLAKGFLDVAKRSESLDAYYRRKYGIGIKEYGDRYLSQHGLCAICACPPLKPFVVDHDHETGTVRGLLCSQCNIGLGMFRDNTASLEAAVRYLHK